MNADLILHLALLEWNEPRLVGMSAELILHLAFPERNRAELGSAPE